MAEYQLVGLRQFREKLDTFTEPIKVIKKRGDITVLGIWVPEGSLYVVKEAPTREVSSSSSKD